MAVSIKSTKVDIGDIYTYPDMNYLFKRELSIEGIEDGKVFRNQTNKYLTPLIKRMKNIHHCLKHVSYKACGLGDLKFERMTGIKFNRALFMLVKYNSYALKAITCMQDSSYYIDSYQYDEEHYMIVLSLDTDEIMRCAYDSFCKGEYSLMFKQQEDLNTVFKIVDPLPTDREITLFGLKMEPYYVITKHKGFTQFFAKFLRELYGMEEYELCLTHIKEFDFPPLSKQEYFNFDYQFENE